jgi:hypothetical protein
VGIMYWGLNNMVVKHILAGAIGLAMTSTASAAILVVRSSGPSAKNFPPGKSLADTQRITLGANDKLVVLDGRGTRELKGPGTFTPGGPAQASSRVAAASAVAGGTQRRARIGAVRSVSGAPTRSPTIWHVDVTKSATVCLADPRNVTLWRGNAKDAATLTLRSGGNARTVEWPAGQSTLAWPSDLPVSSGADYQLSWAGAPAPTRLKFVTLPAAPVGLEAMASSLIRNGCQVQLDHLIETVRLPGEDGTVSS